MKIALVNNYYYLRGGSERVLFDDQEALAKLGHTVLPFAPEDDRNVAPPGERNFPKLNGHDPNGIRGKAGAALAVIHSRTAGQAFGDFLDRHSFDIVHCHNIYGRLTTAVLDAANKRAMPVVLTTHDRKLVCPAYLGLRRGQPCQRCSDGGYWRCVRWKCHKQSASASLVYAVESYYNRLFGKYDSVKRFLCPSRFMQQSLTAAGIAPSRTAYHPNTLPVREYSPSFEVGDYALYVGRLSTEKGLMTLLRAFAPLEIPVRIAGTGPLESEIRHFIRERKTQVYLEGYCTGEKLESLYRNSAFTVVPSECLENASMAVLESFAYGKPALASAIGGNPELVIDGETGFLFPAGDQGALAELAGKMWANRCELPEMGRSARNLIEQRFNQERRIADLIAIYDEVIRETAQPVEVNVEPRKRKVQGE